VLSLYTPHFRYYYNTDLTQVTQAEIYTSLLLVVFHMVPCCRLCRFQQISLCLAEMHSTADPCWFCMKEERAEYRCQTVISISILRHTEKTRSLSALLWTITNSVVTRCAKLTWKAHSTSKCPERVSRTVRRRVEPQFIVRCQLIVLKLSDESGYSSATKPKRIANSRTDRWWL